MLTKDGDLRFVATRFVALRHEMGDVEFVDGAEFAVLEPAPHAVRVEPMVTGQHCDLASDSHLLETNHTRVVGGRASLDANFRQR